MLLKDAFEINPKVEIPKDNEVPFVTMDQLVPGQRNVEAAEFRPVKGGSRFEIGDTLMARITPCLENGKIARYLPSNAEVPYAMGSTEYIVLRGKPGISTSAFAYYLVSSPSFHEASVSLMTGTSGRQRVDLPSFRELEIDLPSVGEQTKIAELLGSLDDKITTNNKIIGCSSALLEVQYHGATKAKSFLTLGEVAQVFGGSTPSTKVEEYWNGDIQWATPTDITALNGPWISKTARTITDAGLKSMSSGIHPENSILMTSRATIGAIALAARPIATNQGFIVVEASDELTPWLYAQMIDRQHEFESWANGATFMELSRGNFKKLPFYSCEDSALAEFNSVAWPLLDRMKAAQAENETLARTRDELLPLLMSGRITVAGASKSGVGNGADGLLEGMN